LLLQTIHTVWQSCLGSEKEVWHLKELSQAWGC